ncbi:acyl dehydratase [Panacagrimonas perspica]|uniref:Acyl dehydratase n=1 Tax=Panacagrimonas perspica TaxID=381431 RepID=A0A4R7P4X8_9GAMM|nr:MaoC family dehydratase N-terminal domain-containing protein [Panacagrimonas perspica]TDU28512.1 acyl dehydratase [Panacagrimonas perspica]THD00908.1 acyl dehydratase [Panacagrimonas perspica]
MIDRSWIGQELPAVSMTLERGRLRFFAKAIGETDPVYTDVEAAKRAGYADLPAPPTFLFGAELDGGILDRLLADLKVPIAKILHGEQGFTYYRPACAGETITVQSRIADIFDKKNGALEFIVKTSEARNAAGERVAELRSVIVVRN